jgi:hypothetical protein
MPISRIYALLPSTARYRLKKLVRAAGHRSSIVDGLKARRDAAGKRRLDVALRHVLNVFRLCNHNNLDHQRVVDFGAGYVLADSVALWLLGAEKIFAVDINAVAHRKALIDSVRAADDRAIRDLLGSLPEVVREKSLQRWERLGKEPKNVWAIADITYLAPRDILKCAWEHEKVDLVWSTSVLEHIPPTSVQPVLSRLQNLLAPGAKGIHFIASLEFRVGGVGDV